jgi:molybdopterin-synthase adenylyltransferase
LTEYHVAMSEETDASLRDFLLRDMEDEEICFATWFPSKGKIRYSGLISSILLPGEQDRVRHGNFSALPSYVDRVKEEARVQGAGLMMIHTHPLIGGWQRVSDDDLFYERNVLAREVYGITGLPFIGMTLARDGKWSARFYPVTPGNGAVLEWCTAVRIVGKNLVIQYNDGLKPPPLPNDMQMRSSSVWGPAVQSELARIRIGVIGAGSVGSVVAETLARIGVGELYVIDYDKLKVHNLDRSLYATPDDLGKLKAHIVSLGSARSATAVSFASSPFSSVSIVEEEGYRLAKDCDVLFSCVDRPWPRQVMNHIAYTCIIPSWTEG